MGKMIAILSMLLVAPFVQAQSVDQCAGSAGKVVLLVNLVEPQATHSHLGVTAFSTSDRRLEGEWGFDRIVAETATRMLEEAGHRVIPAGQQSMPADRLGSTWFPESGLAKPKLRPEFVAWMKAERDQAGGEAVVLLRTYGRPYGPMINAYYTGYGVMSIHDDPPKHVFLFANVLANVLSGDSFVPEKIAKFRDNDCRERIDATSLGTMSFKTWSADTFKAYLPGIATLAGKRIRQDLTAAGLIPGVVERCALARV